MSYSQSRKDGRGENWFPSKWGEDDELGTMNLITPSSILRALALVKKGKVYELGRVLEPGMPVSEFHGQYFANTQYTLENGAEWHNLRRGALENGYSAQNLRLSLSDQSGTHIDQLNHVGLLGEDGKYRLYNGVLNSDIISSFGTSRLGVETMPPIICRGIVLDLVAAAGVDCLPAGYAISPEELDQAVTLAGLAVMPGDAVFVHTGWGKKWSDAREYLSGEPGLGKRCADWAADRDIVLWGTDQFGVDVLPFETPGEALPVHIEMLVKHGIRLLENAYLDEVLAAGIQEFCFLALPLKIKGGTGSPLRPIALV